MQVLADSKSQSDEPGFFDSIISTVSNWFTDEPEEHQEQESQNDSSTSQDTHPPKQSSTSDNTSAQQQTSTSSSPDTKSQDTAVALFGSLKSAAKDVALQTAGQMATDQIQKSTEEWRAQLNSLIEDKSCDSQQQCRVVGVGHLPCGGPSIYLVYSTKTASGKQVESIAQMITDQERKLHKELGTFGICKATPEIKAQCVNKTCIEVGSGMSAF